MCLLLVCFYRPQRSKTDNVTLDGHDDFAIWLRVFHGNHIDFNASSDLDGMVDFPRIRYGRLGAQFWSIYVPCPNYHNDFSSQTYFETIHDTLQQIDLINRLIAAFPSHLQHAFSAADVQSNFKHNRQAVSSLMGAEGLHQIGNSASVLRLYYRLGVRYVSLTHDCNNIYADAALAARPVHGGLSDRGREVVREMNRLGMLVDLSHTSDDTMRDVLKVTLAPVIFSHSNARSLCDHPRNVPDDILDLIEENGGVVMVTFYAAYTNCEAPAQASLDDVADHMMYIGRRIGFRHVGIGSDFDGMAGGPEGLEDVSKYPNLVAALVERGVNTRDIKDVISGNALRVLAEAERVAEGISHVEPLEDNVKSMPHLPTSSL
ncbi:hypothetical protein OCU04_000188 [Sclerotinia nivalis]|uniref:Dipeptidase n=1 Tax=Sclerotinia nivalis TaxID=352851 RepID=A0A9X0AVK8_9HELO|nr:hypothetical protein OCU04_000188 [Sclerotinia nivalis]